MLLPMEIKLWGSNACALFEGPCYGPVRTDIALAPGKSAASFRLCGASSQVPFLCLSTGAYTKEFFEEVAQSSIYDKGGACEVGEENGDETAFVEPQKVQLPLVAANGVNKHDGDLVHLATDMQGDMVHSDYLAADMQDVVGTMPREVRLRLDALDMQRDFRGRPLRPLLDVDRPTPVSRSKPGKRQNVPLKARRMILSLRDLPVEEFATALKHFKSFGPERADWVYVLRYFREKEDKSMLLEVYNFVLLQPAFKASARDYTNLIRVFAQLKNHVAVERTLKVMVEREVFPDLVTYTVVIGMYGKLGHFNMVKSKFNELKVYGLVPDTIIYCAVIEAYSQLGYAAEVESILEVMERAELPLKIEIFISLIRGYGNLGRVVDAERVFQLMQAKLLYPERRSYSALMDAYTKDEDVKHAIQVFNNMVEVGIEPTDKSLARLLIACEQKNMLQEAMEIVEKLESKSFKFGTNMLVSFSGWLAKLRLEKEVELMSLEVEKRLEQKAYVAKKWSPNAYVPASYSI